MSLWWVRLGRGPLLSRSARAGIVHGRDAGQCVWRWQASLRSQRKAPREQSQVAVVVKTVLGSHFGGRCTTRAGFILADFVVGEFTTHFRTYFSGWIGMFTGGKPGFDPWPSGCFSK